MRDRKGKGGWTWRKRRIQWMTSTCQGLSWKRMLYLGHGWNLGEFWFARQKAEWKYTLGRRGGGHNGHHERHEYKYSLKIICTRESSIKATGSTYVKVTVIKQHNGCMNRYNMKFKILQPHFEDGKKSLAAGGRPLRRCSAGWDEQWQGSEHRCGLWLLVWQKGHETRYHHD